MQRIKKYFGELNMSWAEVIIFAVISGVYTGAVCLVPFFKDTSVADIGINFECWILFAVFIIVNCKKWWEASLKCFVFFLISQPIVYLVQVPFYSGGWSIFRYYEYWFIVTLLTLPGGAIAFFVKKKNALSVIILAVATSFLAYLCVNYFSFVYYNFPYHLLSCIFCLALAVFFVFVLFEDKKHIAVSLCIILAALIVSFAVSGIGKTTSEEISLASGNWKCRVEDESVVTVEITSQSTATVHSGENGDTLIRFENDKGEMQEYFVTVNKGNIFISKFE